MWDRLSLFRCLTLQCAGIPIRPSSNENSLNSIAWSWRVPAIGVICEFTTSNNIFLSSCKSFKVVCFFSSIDFDKCNKTTFFMSVPYCQFSRPCAKACCRNTHFVILIQVRCSLFRIIPKNRQCFLAEIKNKINWRGQRGKKTVDTLHLIFSVLWFGHLTI